jgi:hypothetical protein
MHVASTNLFFSAYMPMSVTNVAKHSAAEAVAPATTATSGGSGVEAVDFTHMTRKQLFDWMNDQIKSGKMTFEQSAPFLGMTLKIAASGDPVDMSTDNTIQDFMATARRGIEGARWRNDEQAATRLEEALAVMQREQGKIRKIDVTA